MSAEVAPVGATSVTEPPPLPVVSSTVGADPVGEVAGLTILASGVTDRSLRGQLTWSHLDQDPIAGFDGELSAELRFTELDPVDADADDDADAPAVQAYRVDAELRFAPGARCTSARRACQLAMVTDVDLVGLAVLRDNAVTLELDWPTFGSQREPSRAMVTVAIDGHPSEYAGVAAALEGGGLVGKQITVGVRSPEVEFHATGGAVFSHGSLRLEVG